MSIKLLKSSDLRPVQISLKKGCLALVANYSQEQRFFVLDNPSAADYQKIADFGVINSIRAIGFVEIFSELKEKLPTDIAVDKFVELKEETTAFFYPETQKIRILRDRSSTNGVLEKKKVLVVDDSKTIQKLLRKIIGMSEKLEVIGVAGSAEEAKGIILDKRPDLITLDIHMPGMNGVEFLKTFLGKQGIPTVMISSVSMNEGPLVLEALASGAQTYIQKPSIEKMGEVAPDILEKLESIADMSSSQSAVSATKGPQKVLTNFSHFEGLIAIGSSTGGTQALQDIFTCFPQRIPPVVVVQHIPAVFSKAFADRLNSLCPFTVKEAEDGEFLRADHIYIAPGGKQMRLLKRGQEIRVEINDDEPVNRFKPSVDYLFEKIPKLEVENLLGVILTGMGRDGAKGLLTLKDAGAMTITQDEDSSVVYGMPKAAYEIGASCKVSSLDTMAFDIVTEFNRMKKAESA